MFFNLPSQLLELKSSLPTFLVLQNEAICFKFTAGTLLPIKLETSKVADCVSIIIYSIEKGIAYLAHVLLSSLHAENLQNYQDSILSIIEEFQLNNSNTFVALLGGQNYTLPEKFVHNHGGWAKNPISCFGVLAFEKLLKEKKFDDIYKDVGGDNRKITRSIELSLNMLKYVKIKFPDINPELVYKVRKIADNVVLKSDSLLEARYYQSGILQHQENFQNINNNYNTLQNVWLELLPERCRQADTINGQEWLMTTVTHLVFNFALVENTKRIVSSDIYRCAIYKPTLFCFIKKYFNIDSFLRINRSILDVLNLSRIQQFIREGKLAPEQILNADLWVLTVLSNSAHCQFLIKNLGIAKLIRQTSDDAEIVGMLKKLDELIISEDLHLSQISTLTFDALKEIMNGGRIEPVSRDTALHMDLCEEEEHLELSGGCAIV